jgi:FtsZ-interacting cell division protein ZipA
MKMVLLEIIYIVIGIIVAAIVVASLIIFRRKTGNNDDDFTKFVKQTAKNLSDIDKVLSYFNDRLENLERKLNESEISDDPPEDSMEPEYISTKYYAYEDNGKIVIEIYKNNDVKVILPEKQKTNENKQQEEQKINENKQQEEVKEEVKEKKDKDYRKILLENLKTPKTWKEIIALGIPNTSVLITQLKKEGLVKKDESGHYIAVENKKS